MDDYSNQWKGARLKPGPNSPSDSHLTPYFGCPVSTRYYIDPPIVFGTGLVQNELTNDGLEP